MTCSDQVGISPNYHFVEPIDEFVCRVSAFHHIYQQLY